MCDYVPLWNSFSRPNLSNKVCSLIQFCDQRTSCSELFKEIESERRKGGNEARMVEPLTCFELMVKCNNG